MVFNLDFKINGFDIQSAKKYTVPCGNKNYVYANFEFSDDWTIDDRWAIFTKDKKPIKAHLEAGSCRIPSEILATKGVVSVGVIAGDRAVTIAATFTVGDSIFIDDAPIEPFEPSYTYVATPSETSISIIRHYEGVFQFFTKGEWRDVGEGSTGAGVPSGGSKGQVLTKRTADNYDTNWSDLPESGGAGPKGDTGKSAYEIAVDNGFLGSEQEWLVSLQGGIGPKGADGYTPVKGVDYFDGSNGDKGADGYTPIKGVDYFDGVNGYNPVKGIDYWTSVDIEFMIQEVLSRVVDGNEVAF